MEPKEASDADIIKHKPSIFENTDKLKNMFTKLDKAKRSEESKVAETLDFFEDPQYLI
jgi:hypothetical protein